MEQHESDVMDAILESRILYPPYYQAELARAEKFQWELYRGRLIAIFGISSLEGPSPLYEPSFFGFVAARHYYNWLVSRENDHYRAIHETDPRFGGQPPPPGQAYERTGLLSREEMLNQHQLTEAGRSTVSQLAIYHGDFPSPFAAIKSAAGHYRRLARQIRSSHGRH